MALDALTVKGAKPKEKTYRLFDGNGLYLEVTAKGGKLWRLKYRYAGKEKRLSFGAFPDISLKKARALKDEARKQLADDVDPGELKKETKRAKTEAAANSFEVIACEWAKTNEKKWSAGNFKLVVSRLKRFVFPRIGRASIANINAPELLAMIRRIEKEGSIYTAHKVLQNCGQVFRYSIATGRSQETPPPPKKINKGKITLHPTQD